MEGDGKLAFRFSKFTIKMAVLRRLETGLAYPSCGAGIPRGWRDTRGFSHVPTSQPQVRANGACRCATSVDRGSAPSINPGLADYQGVKPL